MTGFIKKPDCHYYYNKLLKKNVYTSVDIEPEFPGGAAAYQRFLNRNIKITDENETDTWNSSVTFIFIVDTDGQIKQPAFPGKEDTTDFSQLEKGIFRALKLMPKWTPGQCHGKIVSAEVKRSMVICFASE